MAERIAVELIVTALAQGFAGVTAAAGGLGSKFAAASRGVGEAGKFRGAELKWLEQGFKAASENAAEMGRADVVDSIAAMGDELTDLRHALLEVPLAGRDVLDWFGDAAEGATGWARLTQALAIKYELAPGAIDQETAVARANQIAVEGNQQAQLDAQASMDLWQGVSDRASDGFRDNSLALAEA